MIKKILLIAVLILTYSCAKDSDAAIDSTDDSPVLKLSTENELTSFKIKIDAIVYETEIRNDSIIAVLPSSIALESLSPDIIISDKASVNPASGVTQDFNSVILYEVTAEDNSKKTYTAIITKQNSKNSITYFQFTNLAEGQAGYSLYQKTLSDIDTIIYKVPYLSPIRELTSNIIVSENASVEPESGETLDYSEPINYKVTAEDGSQKEYMVIVDNALKQLKINRLTGNTYRNIKPSEPISFFTSGLNPIQDSIQVKLLSIDGDLELDLEVNTVNYETNEVSVFLPSAYVNDNYRFKVFIEHDNYDESDGFNLDGGTPNFKNVVDYFDDGVYIEYNSLLIPKELFNTRTYINRADFDNHEFYLRKNGQDYLLENKRLDVNFEEVDFRMPELPTTILEGGLDFEFVIKYEGDDYIFPFINTSGSPINVTVPKIPVINSVSSTTVTKGGELTIFGDNLYYSFARAFSEDINQYSSISLSTVGGGSSIFSNSLNSDGSLSFDIRESVQAGTYDLAFKNNISDFEEVVTSAQITVELPASTHLTLDILEAKIYSDTDANVPKQILITFNGDITGVAVKRVEIYHPILTTTIENFFTNTATVLTRPLSDEEYDVVNTRLPDGFVIIEDQGVEHKIWFKLTRN